MLAARADDRVDLLALDTVVRARVAGGGHRTQLPRLIDALASLEPALAETDYSLLGRELLRRDRKRSLVVIFTALDIAPMIEGLLPLLPRLAARHKVVVAGVRDPAMARLATLPAEVSAADVHAAAAAERVLGQRDRLRDLLDRSGATVVDADADTFASKVADVYLLLKATGRL
ncbi:hypothetical protein ACFQZH_36745 [Paractinoplanes durhamensis]|uniref:DUF58 domain-containing protein n=1 Tax=Paractinoplanes durhamensis TaxID=113563 RepID=UPI00363E9F2A